MRNPLAFLTGTSRIFAKNGRQAQDYLAVNQNKFGSRHKSELRSDLWLPSQVQNLKKSSPKGRLFIIIKNIQVFFIRI